MDVTCKINGADFSHKLSTFRVQVVPEIDVITAISGKEHPFVKKRRNVLTVSFLPMTDEESMLLYEMLSDMIVEIGYSHAFLGDLTEEMRVTVPLEAVFALRSVDGKKRYTGGEIEFRALG